MQNVLLAVLPLAGVVLGAFLQNYLGRLKGESERVDQRRNEAYSDYLRSVSTIANSQKSEDRQFDFKLLSLLADAKCRIAIYGSGKVISCLADFERQGAVLSNEPSMDAFLLLAQSMRSDAVNKENKSSKDDLRPILFGHR